MPLKTEGSMDRFIQDRNIQRYTSTTTSPKATRETHERARARNKKLGDGAGRLRPNLSDAPEEEKRNATHWNFVPQRDHRVPQFMEQHAHEEHDGRHRAHEPVQQRRPVLELGGIIVIRQHPSEQGEDHKPGVVQPNRNP